MGIYSGFVTTYLSPTEYDLGLMGYTIGYKPLNSVAAHVICTFLSRNCFEVCWIWLAVIARRQGHIPQISPGEPEMGVWGKKTGIHLDNLTHDVFGNEEKNET